MPQPKKYQSDAQRQAAYRLRAEQARQEQLAARSLPPLPAIPSMPGEARWKAALSHAHALVEKTLTEMQDYYDDRSEPWQESERGWTLADRIQALQDCLDTLEQQIG
ncbi:MAG: hypothetical protein M3Y56_04710 [Armatimonadota bacterium]|nr:hypothetical protein [Armatimonadota bacterium]